MHLFLSSAFALQAKAIPSVDIRTTHKTSSIGFKFKKMTFSIHHFPYLQHTINLTHAPNSPASTTIRCMRTETGSWINTVWPAKMFDDDTIKFFTEAKQTRCRTCKVVKLHVFHNYSKRSCQYIESYFFIHPHQRHRFQLYHHQLILFICIKHSKSEPIETVGASAT